MLINPRITAFLPTIEPQVSKHFYMNVLGLKLVTEDDYALEFIGGGVSLRITMVENFNPHPFTVLGFRIEDIATQIESLTKKGVVFKRYDHFEQDDLGIWIAPSMAKVAWFTDPDGNLLSMTEYPV